MQAMYHLKESHILLYLILYSELASLLVEILRYAINIVTAVKAHAGKGAKRCFE